MEAARLILFLEVVAGEAGLNPEAEKDLIFA